MSKLGDEERTPERARRCAEHHARLFEPMRARARELGYALAVHGSIARDIDYLAVPWTDEAVDVEKLVRALVVVVAKVEGRAVWHRDPDFDEMLRRRMGIGARMSRLLGHAPYQNHVGKRAHGRRSYTIDLWDGPYIDLSVMPRST